MKRDSEENDFGAVGHKKKNLKENYRTEWIRPKAEETTK